jgi:hypothetical protein
MKNFNQLDEETRHSAFHFSLDQIIGLSISNKKLTIVVDNESCELDTEHNHEECENIQELKEHIESVNLKLASDITDEERVDAIVDDEVIYDALTDIAMNICQESWYSEHDENVISLCDLNDDHDEEHMEKPREESKKKFNVN